MENSDWVPKKHYVRLMQDYIDLNNDYQSVWLRGIGVGFVIGIICAALIASAI